MLEAVPHAGGDGPVEGETEHQDQPVGWFDLVVLQVEGARLQVGEHRLDAPAQTAIVRPPRAGRIGQRDDPGLGMPGLVQHGAVGAHAALGPFGAGQVMIAACKGTRRASSRRPARTPEGLACSAAGSPSPPHSTTRSAQASRKSGHP